MAAYARVAVARSAGGFTIASNVANLTAVQAGTGTAERMTLTAEGIVKRAVRPDFSQLEPRFRDTSPSGIASQPTGNGRPRTSRAAHISSGTSIRTKNRFQGSVVPRPKCALVSQAASEIDVAA